MPLQVEISRNDFHSLIQDVDNNLNNNEFKTTANKKDYDLKNVKKFLVKIITQKIGKNETRKLYSNLIITEITVLKKNKG